MNGNSYQNIYKNIDIKPIAIKRISLCKAGVKTQRYSYRAVFLAPNDAEFKYPYGTCTVNINRAANISFNPNKLVFIGDTCMINQKDN